MHKGLFRVYADTYKDIFSKNGQSATLGRHRGLKRWGKQSLSSFATFCSHTNSHF